jgi:hypothetical protein
MPSLTTHGLGHPVFSRTLQDLNLRAFDVHFDKADTLDPTFLAESLQRGCWDLHDIPSPHSYNRDGARGTYAQAVTSDKREAQDRIAALIHCPKGTEMGTLMA